MQINSDITYENEWFSGNFKTDAKMAVMRNGGGPCREEISGSIVTVRDCFEGLHFRMTNDQGESQTQREKSLWDNVTYANDDTTLWHESGTVRVSVQNWNGTVTFAGGSTAPSFSVTLDGETKEGTVGEVHEDIQTSSTFSTSLRGKSAEFKQRAEQSLKRLLKR